ncbi:MAG TPA: acetate--CoA ligase family protein, partial [Anaerolineaceae bacterium]
MGDPSLVPFFQPRGVVILGASHDPTKLGYGLAYNLQAIGFPGAVHFVNPKGGRLFGRAVYRSVSEVPDPVDLAVLLTPPAFVAQTLAECGERGIRAAIVSSGGFRETGAAGAELEEEVLRVARSHGMRIIGPNCVGVVNTHLPVDTTFLPQPGTPKGDIAFISHSGAICSAVNDWMRGQGLGISLLISLGNQADIHETDVLEPVSADPHTRVITLYIEGFASGRRFAEEVRAASARKPVIALKVGRYESGQRAAASHTGALAGADSAVEAAFQQSGVLRASTTEEMFQWARALAWSPLPKGKNVAVLTNAGGPGVAASDALESNGLKLAVLDPLTIQKMKEFLPPAASLRNPVDMLASGSPENYASCLSLLLADPGVDMVLMIVPAPPMFSAGAVAKATLPIIQSAEKPVVVALMGDRLIAEAAEHYRAAHIAEYRFPEWAASALGALSRRAEISARAADQPLRCEDIDRARAERILDGFKPGETIGAEASFDLLEAYGIRTMRVRLAANADQAAGLAEEMGFPVVLKVASPDISHKSDVGGVVLGLTGAAEVMTACEGILQRVRAARPEARIEGVHVQRMLPAGQDVIAGVVRDPSFGPVAMFGSGGVEVEGLKDVAFGLAPLFPADLERMLTGTWAGRKLKGFRNLPPADEAAVQDALIRLAQLAADFPQLAEIEMNPLRVLP